MNRKSSPPDSTCTSDGVRSVRPRPNPAVPPLFAMGLAAIFACACGGDSRTGEGTDASDGRRDAAVVAETAAMYTLRNQAKLEADRDSDEGYQAAATLLEELAAAAPIGLVDRLNLARVLVFTDRPGDAGPNLEAARELLGGEPAPADLEYVEGLYANRIQNREAALVHFTRVTELRPEHIHGWYQRGYAEERLKDYEASEASYSRVLELDPENRAAAYRRVIVLRQLGRAEDAEAAFAEFQSLPQEGAQPDPEKCDLTQVSLIPLAREEAEPPASELTWTDVTETSGGAFARLRSVREWTGPNDLDIELALLTESGVVMQRVLPDGRLTGRNTFPSDTGRGATDLEAGDVDNDGFTDLVVVGRERVGLWFGREDGRFVPAPRALPASLVMGRVELWDLDHDGDLDIVGLQPDRREGALVWLRNNGDRTFQTPDSVPLESPGGQGSGADVASAARGAIAGAEDFGLHDLDRGSDLDIVVTGPEGTVALVNLRNGKFRPILLEELGPLAFVRVEDLNNDGAPDIFGVSGAGAWVRAFNADREGRVAEFRVTGILKGSFTSPPRDVLLEDFDNDGDLDVLWCGGDGMGSLRNEKGGTFTPDAGFVVGEQADAFALDSTDMDNDGKVEVWVGTNLGSRVLEAENSRGYRAWRVRPKGARDNRDAVGLIVQQFAGVSYQSRILHGSRGIRLGLVDRDPGALDGLRMSWPQGIIQSESRDELVLNSPHEFRPTQDEGLVASCPFLYAEGPDGWHFLTDVVGIAPLDEWLPDGIEPHLDPEEYVRIEGKALRVEDGRVRLAITEELRETTYLDRVELVVVEHPSDVTLFLDESSRQGAYDPLHVYAVSTTELESPVDVRLGRDDAVSLRSAGAEHGVDSDPADQAGRADRGGRAGPADEVGRTGPVDLAGLVSRADGRYLHGYAPAPSQWSGWVERYGIELTAPPGAGALFLTGRIGWYDSSVSYALYQQGRTWGPLRLEEEGAVLVEDLGVPAGMDRTMVTLLPDPRSETRRLQLSGQHRFLWDRIAFAPTPERMDLGEGEVQLELEDGREVVARRATTVHAELEFHGYSPMRGDRALHEQTYDFEAAVPGDAYERAWGPATRYGDVLPVLASHDDQFVVLVAGDRVMLDFALPSELAGGPESVDSTGGTSRTYFLKVTGWAKEGSFHNATGRWIEPLPYREMDRYPPSAPRTADAGYLDYLGTYQTRVVRSH